LRWIDCLADAGRLPNFYRLIRCGVSGPLETVHFASPIIWTCIATGVGPDRHGIGGFLAGDQLTADTADNPTEGQESKRANSQRAGSTPQTSGIARKRPTTVVDRTRPAFWNILSHYDWSVGVLAWWATYPAE